MNCTDKVAVCSRSFSKNRILRNELSERYQYVTFNDTGVKLDGETLVEFLRGQDKAITALETIDEYVLSRLPELKLISKYGVGLDMIDMEAIHSHGKRLVWTEGVNKRSVAELVLSFAISMLRHVPVSHQEVISGIWRQHIGGQISGRTVGIIGCGNVGKDLVTLLQPFSCRILVNDIQEYPEFFNKHKLVISSLDNLLINSDIVTLHVPLDDSTRGILSEKKLSLMKPGAVLINTARGGLVDEIMLKQMLKKKSIAAAAFDVFAVEPPLDQELLSLPNFLATPHIGGSAEEAILAMGRAAIDGLDNNDIPD